MTIGNGLQGLFSMAFSVNNDDGIFLETRSENGCGK